MTDRSALAELLADLRLEIERKRRARIAQEAPEIEGQTQASDSSPQSDSDSERRCLACNVPMAHARPGQQAHAMCQGQAEGSSDEELPRFWWQDR